MSQPRPGTALDRRPPGRLADLLRALLDELRALRGAVEASLPAHSTRDRDRLALGRDAVLSLGRAAELLPMADGDARAWLRAQGLVVRLEYAGRDKEVVCWGAVLDRLHSQASLPATPEHPARVGGRRPGLRRVNLG